ncbi:MAG TPA: NAD(P)/FAD-dependent oxidoreductase [Gemmatimonadaceae bacterium]|nr:NAD(P)/FAD-dependent oxidoreductase [Gemmatimonadaceae bacterium]
MIVIGAGAAGLAAAAETTRVGLRTVVVEARDRVGGRVHTVHDPASPVPIELGAEFIHGRPPSTWSLVQRDAIAVVEVGGERFHGDGGALRRYGDFDGTLESAMEGLDAQRDPDRSFADYIVERYPGPEWHQRRELALRYVRGFHAARPERISERALAINGAREAEIDGMRAFRVVDGYDRVIQALRRGVPDVRLSTVVETVQWSAEGVTVQARSGREGVTLRARAAVVALPLGVLKAPPRAEGAVRFDPPLDAKASALSRLEVGAATHVALRFTDRFWEDATVTRAARDTDLSTMSFLFSERQAPGEPDDDLPVWWSMYPIFAPILVGWAGGPAAELLAGAPTDALASGGAEVIARLLGADEGAVSSRLAASYAHDWLGDPYSRGAYSYAGVGGADAPAELGRPIDDVLFFAGEATDGRGDSGTVHGAIESGWRAAREVTTALGGRAPTRAGTA